jgi:hypothetical protein
MSDSCAYIIELDGIIVWSGGGFFPNDNPHAHRVPNNFPNFEGHNIREFNADFTAMRPLQDLIDDGFVVVSEAEKIEGERVVAKNALERIRDGLDKAPQGLKIQDGEDGALDLVPMTYDEQVAAGQMTPETARLLKTTEARGRRSAEFQRTDWTDTVSAQKRLSAEELAAWDTYRQHLRDITGQSGFPDTIDWGAAPDGVTP